MRTLLKTLLLLSLSFACSYVLADNSINFDNTGLHPASNDQSLYYLGLIFGKVGNVLNGTGGQALGLMFGEFNRAVLILGTIIFTYVYGKGILDTAAHGEFLGKQANSLWVPLRSVGGMALMIPKASSGYCIIQVFLMWVVVQGVGAADMIWNTAASAMIENGGSAQSASSIVSGTIANLSIGNVQTVFNNLVCGYALQRQENGGQFKLAYSEAGNNRKYSFDYTDPSNTNVSCGNITWSNSCKAGDQSCLSAFNAQLPAIKNIIQKLKPVAHDYVYDAYRHCQKYNDKGRCVDPAFPTSIGTDTAAARVGQNIYNRFGKINFAEQYANDYVDDVASRTSQPKNSNNGSPTGHQEIDDGWITAGSFIYKIARGANVKGTVPTFSVSAGNIPAAYLIGTNPIKTATQYQSNLPSSAAQKPSQSSGGHDKDKLSGLFGEIGGITTAGLGVTTVAVSGASPALGIFTGAMTAIVGAFTGIIIAILNNASGALGGALSAILYLQTFGYSVLIIISATFIAMIVGIFGSALAENTMNCMQPLGYASADTLSFVSIAIWGMMAMLITIAAFLAIYLPLMPFIYFLFGILSWIVAVFETMIAAPIVALGVIHPEGHDFWGKAEPAVMLTINVFLRPSLMLFGLIASLLVSYAFIEIMSMGFAQALFNLSDNGYSLYANPAEGMCIIGLYTFLIVLGCTQCFKLINEVPNRVLQWLGFQGQLGMNAEEASNQSRQNFGQISGAGQGAFSKAEQGARDRARRLSSQGMTDKAKLTSNNNNQLQTPQNSNRQWGPDPQHQA